MKIESFKYIEIKLLKEKMFSPVFHSLEAEWKN